MNTASLHQRSEKVSRRQFLKGLGAGAIAVGAAWMAGAATVGGASTAAHRRHQSM
jgi:hypothetical protein